MMLGARTAAWSPSGAPLPYDAEVEWIETDGQAFIDTGSRGNDKSSFWCRFSFTNKISAVFGYRLSGTEENICVNASGAANNVQVDFGDFTKFRVNVSYPVLGEPFDIVFDRYHVNNVDTSLLKVEQFTQRDGITLFKCKNNPYYSKPIKGTKIFGFGCTNTTMDVYLIPVRFTNENGVSEGAMYDRVSGQLFRNAGTGSVIIGPDKTT